MWGYSLIDIWGLRRKLNVEEDLLNPELCHGLLSVVETLHHHGHLQDNHAEHEAGNSN